MTRDIEKCPLFVFTGVCIKRVNLGKMYELFDGTNKTVCFIWVLVLGGCHVHVLLKSTR